MYVATFPRDEFLAERFDYQPGEHVSFIEPTQGGKTHLMYQMLNRAMEQNPHLRTVSLMPKDIDAATWNWAERLDLEVIDSWPPRKRLMRPAPRGYVLWPKHLPRGTPPGVNKAHLGGIFAKCLDDQFRQPETITVVDDIYVIAVLMELNEYCEPYWVAGGSGGRGLWSTLQKPSGTVGGGHVSTFVYNAPMHLCLGHDPVAQNRKRFTEIGGVDPKTISSVVENLPRYRIKTPMGMKNISEKLYIHKGGPYLGVVGI